MIKQKYFPNFLSSLTLLKLPLQKQLFTSAPQNRFSEKPYKMLQENNCDGTLFSKVAGCDVTKELLNITILRGGG